MKQLIEIKLDTEDFIIARNMLILAGYYNAHDMTDEEVFSTIMSMTECYGLKWRVLGCQRQTHKD